MASSDGHLVDWAVVPKKMSVVVEKIALDKKVITSVIDIVMKNTVNVAMVSVGGNNGGSGNGNGSGSGDMGNNLAVGNIDNVGGNDSMVGNKLLCKTAAVGNELSLCIGVEVMATVLAVSSSVSIVVGVSVSSCNCGDVVVV